MLLYYIDQAGNAWGPHTRGELMNLALKGIITPQTQVKDEERGQWMGYREYMQNTKDAEAREKEAQVDGVHHMPQVMPDDNIKDQAQCDDIDEEEEKQGSLLSFIISEPQGAERLRSYLIGASILKAITWLHLIVGVVLLVCGLAEGTLAAIGVGCLVGAIGPYLTLCFLRIFLDIRDSAK